GVGFTGLSMPRQGSLFIGELQSLVRPVEVANFDLTESLQEGAAALQRLTHLNDGLLTERDLPSYSSVRYRGADDAQVQAWLLKPPGYDPTRKYPFLLFIHGGPQGAWHDAFSYRWNPALFASCGMVVMAINPHGSTGFGQGFTQEISGDWGGA